MKIRKTPWYFDVLELLKKWSNQNEAPQKKTVV